MTGLWRQRWCVASGLAVPLLVLVAPAPLRLAGVAPSWAVLWLLPWALVDGPWSGGLAGLGLGLLLDGLHAGPLQSLPALVVLGGLWGWLGQAVRIRSTVSLALLALLGSLTLAGTLMLQQQVWRIDDPAAWHTLLAQSLITGLLAPLLCSPLLLLWEHIRMGGR